jgi:hypothetical protein
MALPEAISTIKNTSVSDKDEISVKSHVCPHTLTLPRAKIVRNKNFFSGVIFFIVVSYLFLNLLSTLKSNQRKTVYQGRSVFLV